MLRKLASGGLLLVGVVLLFLSLQHRSKIKTGEAAPPFQLQNEAGERVFLEDFRGQVVLINFWATWCLPCVEEIPSLELLHQHFQGLSKWGERLARQNRSLLPPKPLLLAPAKPDARSPFVVLAINEDGGNGPVRVQRFREKISIPFPILFDGDGAVANEYGAYTLPYSFLLDKEGKVVKKVLGAADWMDQDILNLIQKTINHGP